MANQQEREDMFGGGMRVYVGYGSTTTKMWRHDSLRLLQEE